MWLFGLAVTYFILKENTNSDFIFKDGSKEDNKSA